eukprot:gene8248-72_t
MDEEEYTFTNRGILVYKENGKTIPKNVLENKEEADIIQKFIIEHVQKKLTKKLGMKKVHIPFMSKEENRTYILMSTNFTTNTEKRDGTRSMYNISLFLTKFKGSKSKCASHSLRAGSLLQQIAKAVSKDFSILILNPNEPGIESNTPEEHLTHGHGFAGRWIVNLMNERKKIFEKQITAIALVDSISFTVDHKKTKEYLLKNCRHWIPSDDELDKEVVIYNPKTQNVSGGTKMSCKVNLVAVDSIFNFFESYHTPNSEKLTKKRKRKEEEKVVEEEKTGFEITIDLED